MESENFENQLEGQPDPDKDQSKAGVTENEKDMNRQCVTPYSLHPRLQPPAHFT